MNSNDEEAVPLNVQLDQSSLKQTVLRIVEGVTGLEPEAFAAGESSISGLDSIQLVAIAAQIERHLQVELPLSAMFTRSLNDFLSLLERELLAQKGTARAMP